MLFRPSVDVMRTMGVVHCCKKKKTKKKRPVLCSWRDGRSLRGVLLGLYLSRFLYSTIDARSLSVTIMPSLIVVVRYGFSISDVPLPLITAIRATGCIPSMVEYLHFSDRACTYVWSMIDKQEYRLGAWRLLTVCLQASWADFGLCSPVLLHFSSWPLFKAIY